MLNASFKILNLSYNEIKHEISFTEISYLDEKAPSMHSNPLTRLTGISLWATTYLYTKFRPNFVPCMYYYVCTKKICLFTMQSF